MNIQDIIKSVAVTGSATVLHKPGAVRLDDYPLLVFAPIQWGQGVRTENNGTPVADIAVAFAEVGGTYAAMAERFGVTEDHVHQALKYALATGFAE